MLVDNHRTHRHRITAHPHFPVNLSHFYVTLLAYGLRFT